MTVIDKLARKQYEVEPRAYEGRLLHQLPAVRTPFGDAYAEFYLAEPADSCRVALTRAGTRVIEDLATLPGLEHAPWSSRYLQGLIDVPFLNLTPSTRSGIIHDERYAALLEALQPLEAHLNGLIEAQQRAEEEQASQQSLRTIQRAFREALLALPPEEYDWFDIQARARSESGSPRPRRRRGRSGNEERKGPPISAQRNPASTPVHRDNSSITQDHYSAWSSPRPPAPHPSMSGGAFARYRGIDPAGAWRRTCSSHGKSPKAAARSRARSTRKSSTLAPSTPGLARLTLSVRQHEVTCTAEALVTITASLETSMNEAIVNARGLPGYTFERAAGELWRSRFDEERNLIIVNSGHRDFVFATKNRALQLRYLVRLYVKELVLRNFAGISA